MDSGSIIKLVENFNIHKAGTLGIVTNDHTDGLSVIFEDGHYVALIGSEPFQIIGYSRAFDRPVSDFKSLVDRVKEKGKYAFLNASGMASTVAVGLTDTIGNIISFDVGFDQSGSFYQSESNGDTEDGTHTETAEFVVGGVPFCEISGDGWRDIDAGGYLPDFLSDVIFGEREVDEFLANISEALGVEGDPGYEIK
jgi:hypothetical protein